MPVSIKRLKPGALIKTLGSYTLYDKTLDEEVGNEFFSCPKNSIILLLEVPNKLKWGGLDYFLYEGKFLYNNKVCYMYLKNNDDGIEVMK